MRPSLLRHIAYTALGLTLWVALIVAVPLAFLRDAFVAFIHAPSNRDPL